MPFAAAINKAIDLRRHCSVIRSRIHDALQSASRKLHTCVRSDNDVVDGEFVVNVTSSATAIQAPTTLRRECTVRDSRRHDQSVRTGTVRGRGRQPFSR